MKLFPVHPLTLESKGDMSLASYAVTTSGGALTLTCGDDLTGSGTIIADSLTATTSGGATVNLSGAIRW